MTKRIKRLIALLLAAVTFAALSAQVCVVYGSGFYRGVIEDYQNALTSAEEQELLGVIQSAADNIGANVGVVLSDSLNGKSEEKYTDDYMYENFGRESSSIVLMLVKEGSGNQDILAFNEHAHDVYDSQYEDIFDAVYSGMDSGNYPNYPAAIKNFCSYLENNKTGNAGSVEFHFGMGHFIALIFAVVIPLICVNTYAAGYKKRVPISARQYMDGSRTNFTLKQDMFVREFTTSHRISSSSSRSSGGGHRSSGGHSSHGGRHR